MRISRVLEHKGHQVTTIEAAAPVRRLIEVLAQHGIGAVIVCDDGSTPIGIVSERDIVRRLREQAGALLDQPVSTIMTTDVVTCGPGDAVDSVLQVMTERRVRHLPVLEGGRMTGIVSIGDLVKNRIDELQGERDQLSAYISGSRV